MRQPRLIILGGVVAIVGLVVWVAVPTSEDSARERQTRRIIKAHTHRPRVEYRTYTPGGIDIGQDLRLKPVLALGSNAVPFLVKEYGDGVSPLQDLRHSVGLARFGGNDVRMNVVSAVRAIGPQACPVLLNLMHTGNQRQRWVAAYLLGNFPEEAGSIVPHLLRALEDSDTTVVACAAESLGQFGEKARQAVEPLCSKLDLPAPYFVRLMLVRALSEIAPGSHALRKKLTTWTNAVTMVGLNQQETAVLKSEAVTILSKLPAQP